MVDPQKYRELLLGRYDSNDVYLIDKAEAIARKAHAEDTRRGGNPYIDHPQEMAYKAVLAGWPAFVVAVVWVHDVREDHKDDGYDWDDLKRMGLPDPVIELAAVVTHDKKTHTYGQYIAIICGFYWACMIKVLDIGSNIAPNAKAKQILKYTEALLALHAAVEKFEKLGYPKDRPWERSSSQ